MQNGLFNPFNDHIRQLKSAEESERPSTASGVRPSASPHDESRAPRRLLHHAELCDGKFVSAMHIHPSFPGVLAAGYAAKVQLEERQAYRDSSIKFGRHFVLIWKTSKLMEPTV